MSDCNNCSSDCVPQFADIPVARDVLNVASFEPETAEGGTPTVGIPTYNVTVSNPTLPK